jgi:hypothetical protein
MIWSLKPRKTGSLPVTSLLLCAALLTAPGVLAAATRLSAAEILDRYVRVTGGASAWHGKTVERDEIEGRSIDGDRVVLLASVVTSRSGDSFNRIQIPQEGSEGVYKGVAWAWSQFSGVRVKRGMERDEAIRDSRILEEADWRSFYPKSRVVATEQIGDHPCYKVALLPSLTPRFEWFDATTGLLVRRLTSEVSPDGEIEVVADVEDYAQSDGISQPSRLLITRGDYRYRLLILKTAYNEPDALRQLRYPEEVARYIEDEKAAKALPNAEELIERHIFVSGGPDAYGNLRTQRITGTLTFLDRNMEAPMETLASTGGRYYQSIDVPGLGKQEEGSNGTVAWDRSPIIGPRLKPRRSASALGVTLDAAQVIAWRVLLRQVRTEAEEVIDGHDCFRVRMTGRDGELAAVRWYERSTGLLYRTSLAMATDIGSLPVVMTFEEYRDVGEIKWPVRIRMTASGQELLFAVKDVKLNGQIEDAAFDLPAEIKELAEKR